MSPYMSINNNTIDNLPSKQNSVRKALFSYMTINNSCNRLAGPSGQSSLARSMFEGPQGRSLAGTIDVLVRAMYQRSQCLKSLNECQIRFIVNHV